MITPTAGLIGIGYEGRSIDGLLAELQATGVSRLVDVRLTPISRKPGFSKSALARALTAAGIAYEHRRELGNPKSNRPGFAGPPEALAQARATYAELLDEPTAAACLRGLATALSSERAALLCFEADEQRCHRHVVLQRIDELVSASAASTHPAH
ncbi:DUF488 domain-containing protein [Micromonospora sp. NBC_01813]|uniref:DUF488 domain-containing protein n=1 Tax=Micromonospora sp. NBC_01813 TaxID=2975988 RepID=UPI002DDA9303|nr:DUF488 domain-containing protein [Micromonospora sp. NBC_01813]WSA11753.1 DUF488 domain-containing protein [Micromonospora sp. NBC_01813]